MHSARLSWDTMFYEVALHIILFSALASSWICYPPVQLLPTGQDCLTLINGLDFLSRNPAENLPKQWSRHLSTTPLTEQLPKWFYIVDEARPPTTCAIVVDVEGAGSFSAVSTFRLGDVVDAAAAVCRECLARRKQLGLEFPTEEGHVFAKLVRLDETPHPQLLKPGLTLQHGQNETVNWEKWVLPNGEGVLYSSSEDPGGVSNHSLER